MSSESLSPEIVTTKAEVFEIMGNYYGNAMYQDAIRIKLTKAELSLITSLLDEINALGYRFSNLHKLTDKADLRFMPILLKYYELCERKEWLIDLMCHKEYAEYTPIIVEKYQHTTNRDLRFSLSNALYAMRKKQYVPLYLDIVNNPDYIGQNDLIPVILCKYHVQLFSLRFIDLYRLVPDAVAWNLAKYGYMLRDPNMLPLLEELTNAEDKDIAGFAKKSVRAFTNSGL